MRPRERSVLRKISKPHGRCPKDIQAPVSLEGACGDTIGPPPFPARKLGKCMSRRKGQNPKVRVGKRADGTQYYFFQYWIDVPEQEERQRGTEVIGSVTQITRSEAERKKLEFITKLELNSSSYQVPSSAIFANAVKHYRNNFGPAMHRENSTLDVWKGRIKNHLDADWNDVPIEHITIESVNQWAWKKRRRALRGERSRMHCELCSVFSLRTPKKAGRHSRCADFAYPNATN
jgi:hypothetical protein